MATVDILYITLIVAIVVITVTLVWLANDTRALLKSLRRSAEDTEVVTKEIREKVLMVSEALDRAGAAASSIIGMIENAIEEIKEKRDAIVSSIGLLSGAGRAIKERREKKEEDEEEEAEDAVEEEEAKDVEIEMPVKKDTKLAKASKKDDSKPSVDSVAKPEKKKEEKEEEPKEGETDL